MVQPIFEFVGGFWWLVFPLFGILASVGSAWERNARRRHRRRLEVLHAKAELKAAQAAARGRADYAVTGPVPHAGAPLRWRRPRTATRRLLPRASSSASSPSTTP